MVYTIESQCPPMHADAYKTWVDYFETTFLRRITLNLSDRNVIFGLSGKFPKFGHLDRKYQFGSNNSGLKVQVQMPNFDQWCFEILLFKYFQSTIKAKMKLSFFKNFIYGYFKSQLYIKN